MPESPTVSVLRATIADKSVVAGMLQAYLRDMAPFTGDGPDRTEPFQYPYFEQYWSPQGVAEGRVPWFILANDAVAGFAFVNRYSRLGRASSQNIAEFYVQKSWRRNGVGKHAAQEILATHPGAWEIAVLRSNMPARAFWQTVIGEVTGEQFELVRTDPAVWDGDIFVFDLE